VPGTQDFPGSGNTKSGSQRRKRFFANRFLDWLCRLRRRKAFRQAAAGVIGLSLFLAPAIL
jgi:hypothetical protein